MAAKDYIIAVTPLTNTVWITKISKRDKHIMTDDRVKVDESYFIGIVLEWIYNKLDPGAEAIEIKVDGKVVATLQIDTVALGLRPAKPLPKAVPAPKVKTAQDVAKKLAKGE